MNRVEEGLDLSLKNLGLDYLDRVFSPSFSLRNRLLIIYL